MGFYVNATGCRNDSKSELINKYLGEECEPHSKLVEFDILNMIPASSNNMIPPIVMTLQISFTTPFTFVKILIELKHITATTSIINNRCNRRHDKHDLIEV
ncbi:hypothetical protein RYX36_008914 [Vicia faba]